MKTKHFLCGFSALLLLTSFAATGITASSAVPGKATATDLKDTIYFSDVSHHDYNNITEYAITFGFGASIFQQTLWYNDHCNEFLDADGNPIDIGNSILINGKSLEYYKQDSTGGDDAVSNGCASFPMDHGGIWSPVATCFGTSSVTIHINDVYFDDIANMNITFVGGKFAGYNGTDSYCLSEDVTFYATLSTTSAECSGMQFVRTLNEASSTFDVSWIDMTENTDKYYYVRMEVTVSACTGSVYDQGWTLDHYEYLNQYFLVNGMPVSYWNAMARSGAYDWTDSKTQNPLYEMIHPTNAANSNYDRAIQGEMIRYEGRILIRMHIAKQMFKDITGHGSDLESIGLKEGMKFINADASGITRYSSSMVRYFAAGFGTSGGGYFRKSDESHDFNITESSLKVTSTGVPYAKLKTDYSLPTMFGYNISDKDYCAPFKDYILVNGKTITEINSSFDTDHTKIPYKDYNLDWFNAYGVTNGAANDSALTVPVIVVAQEYSVNVALHPTYFASLGFEATITLKAGFKAISDSDVLFTYAGTEDYVTSISANNDLDLFNRIAKYKVTDPTASGIKNLDQTPETLSYRMDDHGDPAYHFSRATSQTTASEFRFYLPGNDYYAETRSYLVTSFSFRYKLNDANTEKGTEGGSTYSNGQVSSRASSTTTSYMIQYVAKNRVSYFCYDAALVNDNAWHDFTLNVTCPNVCGFNIKLFRFQGDILVSDIKAETAATKTALSFSVSDYDGEAYDYSDFSNVKLNFASVLDTASVYGSLSESGNIAAIGFYAAKKSSLTAAGYSTLAAAVAADSSVVHTKNNTTPADSVETEGTDTVFSTYISIKVDSVTDLTDEYVVAAYVTMNNSDQDNNTVTAIYEERTTSVASLAKEYKNDYADLYYNNQSTAVKAALDYLASLA